MSLYTEKLHFKLGLSGTYWDKLPKYKIEVDDQLITSGDVNTCSDEIFYVEFDIDFTEGPSVLKISLLNKDNSDTIENEDKTAILKDMILNIESIEIDEINLDNLIWSCSEFVSDSHPTLKNCVNLGWNGTYQLPFSIPFYIWFLENI